MKRVRNPNGEQAQLHDTNIGKISRIHPSSYLPTHNTLLEISRNLSYHQVMKHVIKRFLLYKQRDEQEEISENDLKNLNKIFKNHIMK